MTLNLDLREQQLTSLLTIRFISVQRKVANEQR